TTSNLATVTIAVDPKTFTVTNTNDSGPGSLRQAIINANLATSATPDTILFKIPGTGPFTIAPQTVLPALTHATVIDGYSQPGATANTLQKGDNAVFEVLLSGLNVPGPDGLLIAGGGSTVKGLDIFGFINGIHLEGSGQDLIAGNLIGIVPGSGVQTGLSVGVFIDGVPANTIGGTAPAARNVISGNPTFGIDAVNATGQLIEGNEIGTDTTGTLAFGNGVGVNLVNSSSSSIGGGSAAAGNLISANSSVGIQLTDSGSILIESNLIGTDVTGTQPLGNAAAGVQVGPNSQFPSPVNTIEKNVISANGDGILIDGAGDNVIQANLIGVDVTGTEPLGNSRHGLIIADPGSDTVGGTTHGAGNTIAFNQLAGVAVVNNATGVEILSNSIFSNGGLGIDLNDDGVTLNHLGGPIPGPNNYQNFPVLTSAVSSGTKMTIVGTLNSAADAGYLIQFFANVAADPSGYGQGQTLIGVITVTTDSTGNASFTVTISTSVPAGQFVSATATDSTGDTSEFAQDVQVTSSGAATMTQTSPLADGLASSGRIVPLPGGATASRAVSQSQANPLDEAVVEALALDLIFDQRRWRNSPGKENQPRYVWR
ncbi:MAG: beta strand repeat-containing protein, partial [Acidimicrobiales bacterium]